MKLKPSLAVALFIATFVVTAIFVDFSDPLTPPPSVEERVVEEEDEGEIGFDGYSGQALREIALAHGTTEGIDITEGDEPLPEE